MDNTQQVAFKLDDFHFGEFSFKTPKEKDNEHSLSVGFNPIGKYSPSTGEFELTLAIVCNLEDDVTEYIKATLVANFSFSKPVAFAEIPNYFYQNAMAIVFPYVRAFVSTLTLQANAGLVVLPTLNLKKFEEIFKQNTKEITE